MINKYPNSSELWFFYDDEISIQWDCDKSFAVWNKRDIINNFTVEESMTPKQAEKTADEWLDEKLEEEKLRHADDFEEDINHEVVNGRDCDGTPF